MSSSLSRSQIRARIVELVPGLHDQLLLENNNGSPNEDVSFAFWLLREPFMGRMPDDGLRNIVQYGLGLQALVDVNAAKGRELSMAIARAHALAKMLLAELENMGAEFP